MLLNVRFHVMFVSFDEIILTDQKKKHTGYTQNAHMRPCFECISKKSPLQCLDHIN